MSSNTKVISKRNLGIVLLAASISVLGIISSMTFINVTASHCNGDKVSETVELGGRFSTMKAGEVTVLLDTTGSGELCVVHIAANLPCSGPRDNQAGTNAPKPHIVVGVAGGALGGVIDSAPDDTGFVGPNGTCVFHDGFSPNEEVPSITDIIIANPGPGNVNLPEGTLVTITGTYSTPEPEPEAEPEPAPGG